MSALPPKADIRQRERCVRFGAKTGHDYMSLDKTLMLPTPNERGRQLGAASNDPTRKAVRVGSLKAY
jgi:hypothetical protein